MLREQVTPNPGAVPWFDSILSGAIMQADLQLWKDPPVDYVDYHRGYWPRDTYVFYHLRSRRMRVHFRSTDAYRTWHLLTGKGPQVCAYRLMLWINRAFGMV